MKKIILVLGVAVLLFFSAMALLYKNNAAQKKRLTVQSIGNNGIFVGYTKQAGFLDQSDISPETKKRRENHERDGKAIDDASRSIQEGISYFKNGDYDNALVAYKKAYATDPLSQSYIGVSLLIPTYEKLGRYDEALSLLNEIEQKYYKGEYGAKKAQEIRARILAAKNVAPQEQKGTVPSGDRSK